MLVTKAQVKYIQSLGHKKFRDEERLFVAEGPKIVGELLHAPGIRARQVYALKEWISAQAGLAGGVPVQEILDSDLSRLSSLSTPNQVLAVFEQPAFPQPEFNKGITVVLDGVQDPGNLGTIVRIADWFGITRVLCTADCADIFNAKTVQSTMGSVSRVQVVYGDPVEVMGRYRDEERFPVYAAVLGGQNLYKMNRTGRGWIVIGNESRGVGSRLLELATERVTIPGVGRAESLNAAVATGIILSHLV